MSIQKAIELAIRVLEPFDRAHPQTYEEYLAIPQYTDAEYEEMLSTLRNLLALVVKVQDDGTLSLVSPDETVMITYEEVS